MFPSFVLIFIYAKLFISLIQKTFTKNYVKNFLFIRNENLRDLVCFLTLFFRTFPSDLIYKRDLDKFIFQHSSENMRREN